MSFLALLLSAALLVGAPDDPDPRCPDNPTCTLTAQPLRGSIDIDGHLDDADWGTAAVATGFKQFEPHEGAPPSQRTEVRILYGNAALYVGAMLYDDAPDKIMRTLGRRDEFNQADWFYVAIDSYFDRKTAYTFAVNAAGVQVDGILTRRIDTSWDAVWQSAARVTDEGWSVELRIPYSMLRFPEVPSQQWGINFRRVIPRLSETDEWVLVPRAELGGGAVARYGILEGLKDLRPRRNLQVTPYTLSRLQIEEGDPGQGLSSRSIDVGGDVKVGLSSNVTLDATINPDFGQVDADPAELNLTAFETFFPERRPFFTEGVQIFDFNIERGDALLYTRRIGARAPIIGATKLSGRTGRGLSFGLLGAATGDDFDPGRLYGVARLEQQLGRLSSLGGILTAYQHRSDSLLERRSLTGGMDWDLRLKDNAYQFDGQVSFTHGVDPGESPKTGFALTAGFDKIQGVWTFFSGLTAISDDYNPNDLGRLRRNNYTNLHLGIAHQVNGGEPFGPFQRGSFRLFSGNGWSYRDRTDLGLGVLFFSDWETRGFQTIDFSIRTDYLFGGYDIYETRGLGPRAQPREANLELSFDTDSRRAWQLEPNIEYSYFGDGGRSYGLGIEADWNVGPRVSLAAEVNYGWDDGLTAWASNETFARLDAGWAIGEESEAPEDVEAFRAFDDGGRLDALLGPLAPYDDLGRYYLPVFARRDTRSLDLTLRSDLTLSPTLSVQFYGQLFAARGRYRDFALLHDPDALAPLPTYPKTHDFAFHSFQTNTVLRWEYRPGSTLFLVWSQSRRGSADLDAFDLGARSPFDQRAFDQFGDTFELFPTNVFLVKFSYKFLR